MDPVSNSPPRTPALDPALRRRSFLGWLTYGLGAVAAAAVGIPSSATFSGAARPRSMVYAGARQRFSPGRNAAGDVRQSAPAAVGRHRGPHRRLRALRGPRRARPTRRRHTVPGAGRQLRPPGLPGRVVSAVGPVHVPLSRRRLLRQRRTRLGPAAARAVSLRVAGERAAGSAGDPGPALSDLARHAGTSRHEARETAP